MITSSPEIIESIRDLPRIRIRIRIKIRIIIRIRIMIRIRIRVSIRIRITRIYDFWRNSYLTIIGLYCRLLY